jgi:hypothetical protein
MSLHLHRSPHPSISTATELRILMAFEAGSVGCWAFRPTGGKSHSIEGIGWDQLWNVRFHAESGAWSFLFQAKRKAKLMGFARSDGDGSFTKFHHRSKCICRSPSWALRPKGKPSTIYSQPRSMTEVYRTPQATLKRLARLLERSTLETHPLRSTALTKSAPWVGGTASTSFSFLPSPRPTVASIIYINRETDTHLLCTTFKQDTTLFNQDIQIPRDPRLPQERSSGPNFCAQQRTTQASCFCISNRRDARSSWGR